ncbi:Suppressor of fused protein (SUFU) [Gemmata sp. SH-PL17]|uniref:suppressor of fused domain protein n=1 Tax=Gemmata sp. SH-PL17 TaxID=1630693 RepID=UPI00078D730A|nr:suppressor of fused domain protein [Gemmata sp. SH-PL17]AMV24067.1 Suppressor of fused protein (SUFU) [Gemmata sp. SH-PL17]
MSFQPLRTRFFDMLWQRDDAGIRQLLINNPAFLNDPECRADLMIAASTRREESHLVELLFGVGVELDISPPNNPINRPVNAAASTNRWLILEWLVKHGAHINYEVEGREPHCFPLAPAILAGRLDVVQLLVEAGAVLDVCDRANNTPLSWAIAYGKTEIADYLRSKGAVESEQARNYRQPPPMTPVFRYMEERCGSIIPLGWQPVFPGSASVTVHTVLHEDFAGAFTDGMSSRPMVVPSGMERYRFAELAMPLGEYWPDHPAAWKEEKYSWAVQWLLRLAEYPFEAGLWLGQPYSIVANGDSPAPLSAYTLMTCWLLLVDKSPLTGFTRPNGDDVVFYTVLPIYTAERDFERRYGLRALLELFAKNNVSPYLDPHRKCLI